MTGENNISPEELAILRKKAEKWDKHIKKLTENLPNSRLTPEQRSELARKAVQARWAKNKKKPKKTIDKN